MAVAWEVPRNPYRIFGVILYDCTPETLLRGQSQWVHVIAIFVTIASDIFFGRTYDVQYTYEEENAPTTQADVVTYCIRLKSVREAFENFVRLGWHSYGGMFMEGQFMWRNVFVTAD